MKMKISHPCASAMRLGGNCLLGGAARGQLILSAIAAIAVVAAAAPTWAQEIVPLGFVDIYTKYSSALGVSFDGGVVAGYANADSGQSAAFLWTPDDGMMLIGINSVATGISADGTAASGFSKVDTSHYEAFRWTAGGGLQLLGTGGYTSSFASSFAEDISSNGNTIVGSVSAPTLREAFAWTQAGGMQLLGWFPTFGRPNSTAMGISDNGIVVGHAGRVVGGEEAFYKDLGNSDPIQGLGYYLGGSFSNATDITPDARFILGSGDDANGAQHVLRWTSNASGYGSAQMLDNANWVSVDASGISDDGTRAVGDYWASWDQENATAFIWTEEDGAMDLATWLANSGVDVSSWELYNANDISGDGTAVVGSGLGGGKEQAYIARAGALIGAQDFSESVASLLVISHLPAKLAINAVNNQMPEVSGMQGLSGTLLYDRAQGSSASLGGALVNWRRKDIALSGGLGVSAAETGALYEGGNASFAGLWLGGGLAVDLGEALHAPHLEGLEFDASLRFETGRATINRNYLNGAAAETATGTAETASMAGALRAAWNRQLGDSVQVTPYAQWLLGRSSMAGYTETGGVGAGSVGAQTSTTNLISLGLEVELAATEQFALGANYAFNHLVDAAANGVSVNVAGLGTFALPAGNYDANWHTLGVDLTYAPSDRVEFGAYANANFGSAYPVNWTVGSSLTVGF